MILLNIPILFEIFAGLCTVASFPIMCLSENLRLGLCMLGMGISIHIVNGWLFSETRPPVSDNQPPEEQ